MCSIFKKLESFTSKLESQPLRGPLNFVDLLLLIKALVFQATGSIDDSHLVVFRLTGILMVCWALGYFLINKSTDSTVETSFMLASLIVSS